MTEASDKKLEVTTGYSKNDLPYFRIGSGERIIVIFGGGPDFQHKPPSGFQLRMSSSSFKELAKMVGEPGTEPCDHAAGGVSGHIV